VLVAASSYGSLFVILLSQALRGQSLVQPDGVTIIALIGWALVTGAAAWRAPGCRVSAVRLNRFLVAGRDNGFSRRPPSEFSRPIVWLHLFAKAALHAYC